MKNKNFALIELFNDECPMIGVLTDIPENMEGFKDKFIKAINSHFNTDDFRYDEIPDLFIGSPYEDLMIEIEGMNYEIRILETWLY